MLYLALVCGCMQVLVYVSYVYNWFTQVTIFMYSQQLLSHSRTSCTLLLLHSFMFPFYEGCYHASNSCKCMEVHGKACLAGTHSWDKLYTAIHIRMCIKSDSVLQATLKSYSSCKNLYQVLNTLESHTCCKEEGSGHAAADELSLRNAIIKQHILIKCWHPLNMWCICYSMTIATKNVNFMDQSKFLP